jgi:hypothetical protein
MYRGNRCRTNDWRPVLEKKKTVCITIETSRLLVILRRTSARAWCEQCASEVEMIPLESAAELAQVNAQTIQLLLANGRFHVSKSGGPVQICLNSLLREVV